MRVHQDNRADNNHADHESHYYSRDGGDIPLVKHHPCNFSFSTFQRLHESPPVFVIPENWLAPIAPRHHCARPAWQSNRTTAQSEGVISGREAIETSFHERPIAS
jgi:hypothetical protein